MKKKNKVIVAVSGGFDPLHIGHVRHFIKAKQLGDVLVVLLNNDNWLRKKKGYCFMNELERMEVIKSLRCVDHVFLSEHKKDDTDMSIVKAIRKLKPHIYAKGGDRRSEADIPAEAEVCREMGIKMIFAVGGNEKVQSSSALAKNILKYKHVFK